MLFRSLERKKEGSQLLLSMVIRHITCYNGLAMLIKFGGEAKMDRRFHRRSKRIENVQVFIRSLPWRLLLLIPILFVLAIPAFYFGAHAGQKVFPAVTNFFYNLSGSPPAAIPTPLPPFPTALPQAGSLLYTVRAGDSCDEILAVQMRMSDAGVIFSDVKPETVRALNASISQDCHKLQPGMALTLSPQYPLLAFGGQVLKIDATLPRQVLPTPVINVSHQQQLGADCPAGCLLTVRLAPGVQVHLSVQTTLPVRVNSWIWAQAQLARKHIKGFDSYPYADPLATLNGMSLRACDLQVDNTHDDNALSCDQLLPNTIDDDGGAWLFGITGTSSLDHWKYPLHLPAGTRVLLWLSAHSNGNLRFNRGNPVFRYDNATHVYIKV